MAVSPPSGRGSVGTEYRRGRTLGADEGVEPCRSWWCSWSRSWSSCWSCARRLLLAGPEVARRPRPPPSPAPASDPAAGPGRRPGVPARARASHPPRRRLARLTFRQPPCARKNRRQPRWGGTGCALSARAASSPASFDRPARPCRRRAAAPASPRRRRARLRRRPRRWPPAASAWPPAPGRAATSGCAADPSGAACLPTVSSVALLGADRSCRHGSTRRRHPAPQRRATHARRRSPSVSAPVEDQTPA